MKAVPINELKKELAGLSSRKILEVCLRLAKYKKENKELLTYLLFESDEEEYIRNIKNEMDLQFDSLNKSNIYYLKKSLRKILRFANKHIKYSGNKQTEADLLIYFCRKCKESNIPVNQSTALSNLYDRQLQKIRMAAGRLHEDLQYDYGLEADNLKITR